MRLSFVSIFFYFNLFLSRPYLLASHTLATIKIIIPTNINEVWIPNNAEDIPNNIIPIISHHLATNSSTHEIVHSSSGFVQSEINADITGRISESPSDIANVMMIMLQKFSLYPSNI